MLKMAGLWRNVLPVQDAFFKVKMKEKLFANIKEAILAWLWIEDQKAFTALENTQNKKELL